MTMAQFMSIALYQPEHGYYARSVRRTGRNGDFFTSVDVGPLFGDLLCRQFAEMWRVLDDGDPFDLVEAGASNGQLARDVMDAAERNDLEFYDAIRLHLVEASPAAREAQPEMLVRHAAKLASASGTLPEAVQGVIYANELLDALPVHSVAMTDHGLREHYVDLDGDRLVERLGPPSTDALERHLQTLGARVEPGCRAEVNLAALAWVARACRSLDRGFLLIIDYGHEAAELYSATHAPGTLTTFQGHVVDSGDAPAWLHDPGTRDITSHVDLTSIRHAAEECGCRTLGVLDQTYFLLALGLEEQLEGAATSVADTKRRLALKTLMLPGGLGSTHKVMVFARNVGPVELRGLSGIRRLT
jgi:SAM-dependent MidA family methyltransferase